MGDENYIELLREKKKILELLERTRSRIWSIFDSAGIDPAFFNIDIKLQVKIEGIEITVSESSKSLLDEEDGENGGQK